MDYLAEDLGKNREHAQPRIQCIVVTMLATGRDIGTVAIRMTIAGSLTSPAELTKLSIVSLSNLDEIPSAI